LQREKEKKDGAFTKVARFIKYNKILVLFMLFLIFVLTMFVFSNNGLLKRMKLENEKKELEKKISIEQKKADSLEKKIKEIQTSDQEIERIAREKYGMTKEGEKIYRIYTDSTK
jgi:cell division protein FtsB